MLLVSQSNTLFGRGNQASEDTSTKTQVQQTQVIHNLWITFFMVP